MRRHSPTRRGAILQIPLHTKSSAEAYIAAHEWRDASLLACPMHPSGGCSFGRHGSYARVMPKGLRVARWYCPQGHRTFSLLPDFLAARLPGLLTCVEAAVAAAKSASDPGGRSRHASWLRRESAQRAALASPPRDIGSSSAGRRVADGGACRHQGPCGLPSATDRTWPSSCAARSSTLVVAGLPACTAGAAGIPAIKRCRSIAGEQATTHGA